MTPKIAEVRGGFLLMQNRKNQQKLLLAKVWRAWYCTKRVTHNPRDSIMSTQQSNDLIRAVVSTNWYRPTNVEQQMSCLELVFCVTFARQIREFRNDQKRSQIIFHIFAIRQKSNLRHYEKKFLNNFLEPTIVVFRQQSRGFQVAIL